MAIPVKDISEENEIDREEALVIHEGFNWDLNSANQTSPLLTVDSSPENMKFASDSLSTPPRMTDSVPISDQSKIERVKAFVVAIDGSTPIDALEYLNRFNWNLDVAVARFMTDRPPTPSQIDNFLSTVPLRGSSSMEFNPTVSIKESAEALMAASQASVESSETVPMVMDSRRTSNQQQRSREQQSQLNDTLIDSFLGFVDGATRGEAVACLKLCDWDVNQAVNYFLDYSSAGLLSEEEILKAVEMNWQENRGNQGYLKEGKSSVHADSTETGRPFNEDGLVIAPVAVSGIVIKNWKPEAVEEDSSTQTGPDPLATQDRNIVEPRAEPVTTEITLQVILADGGNGAEEFMTFRSDQTVRDIRNRIAELRPDDNGDYYLTSVEGEIYDDLKTTVQSIYSRGATELIQVLSD